MGSVRTDPTPDYPINCTGDVVRGDRIRWIEAMWPNYKPRHRSKPHPLGYRTITGHVVADSYGPDKQQHTFTILVTSCEGYGGLKAGDRIMRKGRNVYRNDCYRREWADEATRQSIAEEKHQRGDRARQARDARRTMENGI